MISPVGPVAFHSLIGIEGIVNVARWHTRFRGQSMLCLRYHHLPRSLHLAFLRLSMLLMFIIKWYDSPYRQRKRCPLMWFLRTSSRFGWRTGRLHFRVLLTAGFKICDWRVICRWYRQSQWFKPVGHSYVKSLLASFCPKYQSSLTVLLKSFELDNSFKTGQVQGGSPEIVSLFDWLFMLFRGLRLGCKS